MQSRCYCHESQLLLCTESVPLKCIALLLAKHKSHWPGGKLHCNPAARISQCLAIFEKDEANSTSAQKPFPFAKAVGRIQL